MINSSTFLINRINDLKAEPVKVKADSFINKLAESEKPKFPTPEVLKVKADSFAEKLKNITSELRTEVTKESKFEVNNFSFEVNKKNNIELESNNISPTKSKSLEILKNKIEEVNLAKLELNKDKEDFSNTLNSIVKTMNTIQSSLENPKINNDKSLSSYFKVLSSKMDNIKNSGSNEEALIFSSFIERISIKLNEIKEGKDKSPNAIATVQAEYQKNVSDLTRGLEKKDRDLAIKALTSIMGNNKDLVNNILSSLEKKISNTTPTKEVSKIRSIKNRLSLSLSESTFAHTIKNESIKKVMSNNDVSSNINNVLDLSKKTPESYQTLSKSISKFEKLVTDLNSFINSNEFNNLIAKAQTFDTNDNYLNEIISDLINSADTLESKINFDFSFDGNADISKLLKKLRTIITDLDKSSRNLKETEEASKLIDTNFLKNAKESNDRQNYFNQQRDLLKKNSI